jgi:putative tryptophan/tyrosine transport system substrate-binding protein
MGQLGAVALLIANDPFFTSRSDKLAQLILRFWIPEIYQYRQFVEAGGLMSYGASNTDPHRQLGNYVGRILAGAKPADLPVEQSTRLDLLINLKTWFGNPAIHPRSRQRRDRVNDCSAKPLH